jgi:membrane protease YdiL (CAAX protease family)
MPAPLSTPVRRIHTSEASGQCSYCSAPLDPFYYFCLRCATPYKPIQSITGSVQPTPLDDGQRIAKLAPHTWTVFWTFAAVVIGAAVISVPFTTRDNAGFFYFLSTLAVLVTSLVFASIHWRPLAAQFRSSGLFKWESWAALAALVPLLLLNYGYHTLVSQVPGYTEISLDPALPFALSLIVLCIFPAISEEIGFRGLVQYWLEISISPAKALVLGSAMFAALHFSIISFPYLFLVGVFLAWVRRRTGSLYPGIFLHFLHNLAVITLFRF